MPVGCGCATATALKPWSVVGLALAAIASFHLGFLYSGFSWLVLVWLGCLFALRRTSCGRWSFYTGLAVGVGMYAPQLSFFWTIFGPAAVALWLVLAFWIALFLLLLHGVNRYWGAGWAVGLAPVLWLGLEFFRSELYYLRFAWFTAGSFVPLNISTFWLPWTGIYGLGAVLMLAAALIVERVERGGSPLRRRRWLWLALTALVVAPAAAGVLRKFIIASPTGLNVAGVQLEFPHAAEVLTALRAAHANEPRAELEKPALYLLSEYTFDGPIPDEIRAWCRAEQRWLIAGGKEILVDGKFYNTAYVVSTNGEVVFQQAKAVPIQFFNDGVPAPQQLVWPSPWGPIGICICYDLSYARVVDRLIQQGAQALIVPAMDTEPWGEYQHRLNARMTPIRAAENGVPIFRVASSGISQVVNRAGYLLAKTGVTGQGEVITGRMTWSKHRPASLPSDRYLAPLAVVATGVIMLLLTRSQARARLSAKQSPVPPPQTNPTP